MWGRHGSADSTSSKLALIDTEEYFRRLAAMFRVYKALGVPIDQPAPQNLLKAKAEWAVLSFRAIDRGNAELRTGACRGTAGRPDKRFAVSA